MATPPMLVSREGRLLCDVMVFGIFTEFARRAVWIGKAAG